MQEPPNRNILFSQFRGEMRSRSLGALRSERLDWREQKDNAKDREESRLVGAVSKAVTTLYGDLASWPQEDEDRGDALTVAEYLEEADPQRVNDATGHLHDASFALADLELFRRDG
ncbi:MAG: hypothetical protein IH941_05615 [Acidobacteria bacterium]|nr:hypothetical protein [Acidobacteriota bacterium]